MPVTLDFSSHVSVVTGAASGIGLAVAQALASRGAAVLINDVQGAEAAALSIRERGGRAVASCTPVGGFEAGRRIIAEATDAFGPVDILVNNAGVSAPGAFDEADEARYLRVLEVNLLGSLALTRAAWPQMRARKYGRILNVASNAILGMGRSAAYAASKGGLVGLTKDNAQEGAAHGIKVNAMFPVASTGMTQAIPPGAFRDWIDGFEARHLAAPALLLLSEDVPVSGEIFSCGGGRMSHTAYCNTRGLHAPDASPEQLLENFDQVMSREGMALVANHGEDLARYTEWHPWPEAGGGPGARR